MKLLKKKAFKHLISRRLKKPGSISEVKRKIDQNFRNHPFQLISFLPFIADQFEHLAVTELI